MSFFYGLPPELMTALATVLGFAQIGSLTPDQQNSLGNFLMLIAQVIITNATQAQLLQDEQDAVRSAALEKRISRLEEQLARLSS